VIQFKEDFDTIEIRLPQGLHEILKSMASLENKTVSQAIVDLLEQAVFITPEDLAMIRDKALRKAELDQFTEDEGIMVDKYKGIINEIKKAADLHEKLIK
jgi:hypothetical protein